MQSGQGFSFFPLFWPLLCLLNWVNYSSAGSVSALQSIPWVVHVPSDWDRHSECVQGFMNSQKLPEDIELKYTWKSQAHTSSSSKAILHRNNCMGGPRCVAVLSLAFLKFWLFKHTDIHLQNRAIHSLVISCPICDAPLSVSSPSWQGKICPCTWCWREMPARIYSLRNSFAALPVTSN